MTDDPRMARTILLIATLCAGGFGCSRQAPLVSPAHITTAGQSTMAQRQQAVERAFVTPRSGRTWSVNKTGEGFFIATIQVRDHFAQVVIEYSTPMVTVTYLSSQNLDYEKRSDGRQLIHRNFNNWMQYFLQDVNRELSTVMLHDQTG